MTQKENPMREIRIEKLVLNIGAGTDPEDVDNAVKLLRKLTGEEPTKTHAKKKIPAWDLRPGVPVGAKVTLRGKKAKKVLDKLLDSIEYKLPERCFTGNGFSFGIPEYIQIEDMNYDPGLGIIGLEASVTFERPGFRVNRRDVKDRKIPKEHEITKDEVLSYAKDKLKVKVQG